MENKKYHIEYLGKTLHTNHYYNLNIIYIILILLIQY